MSVLGDLERAAYLASQIRAAATADTAPPVADLLGWSEELETVLEQCKRTLRTQDGLCGGGLPPVGLVRGNHPDTAKTAALAVAPKIGGQRERVLLELMAWDRLGMGGRTDVQLSTALKMPGNTVRPRRVELVRGHWVRDGGERRQHNGRAHVVWVVTDKARASYGP